MPNGESEKLVEAVAERVRAALAEAERRAEEITDEATRRAEEIVAEAEGRAKEIEAEADAAAAKTVALSEDQARERIERARKALDELGLALGSVEPAEGSDPEGRSEAPQPEGSDPFEPDPEPAPQPEPEPEPEPEPAPDPEPTPGKPSTEELIAQLKGAEVASESSAAGGGDEAGARLVAMNMALDGASREDVEKRMADEFGLSDPDALLDEVFDRAGR